MKRCTKCGITKPLSEFYNDSRNKLLKRSYCKYCIVAQTKKARAKNPNTKETRSKQNQAIRLAAINAYGAICACCGEIAQEFLCIDHSENNGAQHRKEVGRGAAIYYWLRENNYPTGFQVLCYNCNCAKAYHGICPHQRKEVKHGQD